MQDKKKILTNFLTFKLNSYFEKTFLLYKKEISEIHQNTLL